MQTSITTPITRKIRLSGNRPKKLALVGRQRNFKTDKNKHCFKMVEILSIWNKKYQSTIVFFINKVT